MTHSKRKVRVGLIVNDEGVTLLELVVYLVISGILLTTAVTSFWGQNSSYNKQDVIAEIQQNIRGVTDLITTDIRHARYSHDFTDDEAFLEAENDSVTLDYLDNISGEIVTVSYRQTADNELQRSVVPKDDAPDFETIAENIDEIRFEYLIDADPDIKVDSWEWFRDEAEIIGGYTPLTGGSLNAAEARSLIRAVKIVILAGARDSAFNATETTVFKPPLEDPAAGDDVWDPADPKYSPGYKRMMSAVAQCRNNRG